LLGITASGNCGDPGFPSRDTHWEAEQARDRGGTETETNADKVKLLVVEDDEELRTQMKWGLIGAHEVLLAGDRPSALVVFERERPPVVTLDLGLPPDPGGVGEGMLTLTQILDKDPLSKVIIITGREEKEHALEAIGLGAYDYLTKPVELADLVVIIRRAAYISRLEREHRELQRRFKEDAFEGMLGTSPQIQEVFENIRKVAATETPVLITGESGTGKELVARAIHTLSARKKGPFVVINCGAIPETLLESELFGHEKGAFTGAHIQRKGRTELANGGTLFLDEIGEFPAHLQVKLLRFLEEKKVERIGGREQIPVDVRVLAATNTDLDKALRQGRFREDLYYRLAVIRLAMPPLREREGDIALLAKAFLQRYASANKSRVDGFTPKAMRMLEDHMWHGNVRELENRMKRAVIMAEGSKVTPAALGLATAFSKYDGRSLREAREALDRELVLQAMARNKGNLTRTASDLGISRPTLYELMQKLGIEKA
jgi:two-component system NtrC family response regulator